jgi:Flp pilus assembly protein TadB
MSLDVALLIVSTAAGVMAVLVLFAGDDVTPRPTRIPRPGQWARLAGAAAVALVVLAASGWLIAAAVVGVGSWHAIGIWQQRNAGGVSDLERIDALASWIENLRDVLIAGDQPVGAINATVATCPAAIKPQVRRLAAGLGRQDPAIVFRRFADDVDDPLGDLVAAGLLIAVQRGARTAAVLGSLAEQARRQADRRRLVEAERAPIQREVTLLTVIMGSLVVGLLVFGRAEYLAPYDTAGGQLFLGLVLAIYAALLLRVQRLARFPRPSRFLTAGSAHHPRLSCRRAANRRGDNAVREHRMRTTGVLALCSIVFCAGAWLASSGWRQPRPRLDRAMAHLRRTGSPRSPRDAPGVTVSIGSFVERHGAGARTRRWTQPLRLVGRSVQTHLGYLVLAALGGFAIPAVVLGVLQALGLVSLGVWIPASLSLVAAIVAPLLVHSTTMAASADVTLDLRHQLGAYLDMVTMLLAGNTGYEGALDQAARAGDGLLFRELRRAMREAGATGQSLVRALERVADDYGIVELEQVAATATLSAAEGAPVARSLSAKCSTLRSTLAAEQEADARVRNDKVTPPLVAMALLFMALIIYPALNLN